MTSISLDDLSRGATAGEAPSGGDGQRAADAQRAAEVSTQLKVFSERLGPVYGTEDWPVFLYALVKMQAPLNVVELARGWGSRRCGWPKR